MNHTHEIKALLAGMDCLTASVMAHAAIARVLVARSAPTTDCWREFLADLMKSAETDLASMPAPVGNEQRAEAIRDAAVHALRACVGRARIPGGRTVPPGSTTFPEVNEGC